MIAKERNEQEHRDTDVFSKAGAEAEKQMAHYLRRAFKDDPEVVVFNDLRIVDDTGEVAQFDHLILHRRGFVVIESKSVTSVVRVNEESEWERQWNGRWQGMASPVLQAQRQVDLLKKLLNAHREELRDKRVFGMLTINFNVTPFEILVAVSDKGRIERDRHTPAEVHKAEAVVDAAKEAIAKHRLGILSPGMDKGLEKYSDREFGALCNFLARRHMPLRIAASASAPALSPATPSARQPATAREATAAYTARALAPATVAPQRPAPAPTKPNAAPSRSQQTCPKCQGDNLVILYGRYGYYWKCNACNHTFDIDRTCPRCGEKTKTRKEGPRFHRDCAKCGTSECFHTNHNCM